MKKIEKKNTITEKQKEEWFEAVRFREIETVKERIEEGIDINAHGGNGWTALHSSCYWGHIEMVRFLLDNGADINIQTEDWRNPLHVACYYEHIETAKLLIDNGANITAKDIYGDTPLDNLKARHPQKYEELIQWITEEYPEKALELMASENIQSKSVGL